MEMDLKEYAGPLNLPMIIFFLKFIILLMGGDKRSQKRDIEKAKEYWKEYQERKDDENVS